MEGLSLWIVTIIFTLLLQGVMAQNTIGDINGIVAAAVVGFFMLCIVIAMIVVGFMWDKWFTRYQRWRGKIKIPRHIIEQRKKRKLAEKALSEKSLVVATNGKIPMKTEQDSKSWVEGWNGVTGREYEEKFSSIELGEEEKGADKKAEEEFRIEAELVDNEALDLGPYKTQPDHSVVTSVKADTNDDTPLYSVVDRASQKSKSKSNGETSHPYEETETSFSAMTSDPAVVIM